MGHINAFVERDHIKVILIANENELIKEYTAQEETDKKPEQFISEDDRKNYEIYNIFKEKIIGKTFEIQSNFDNILNHFLEDYPYKEILLPHIDILKTIYSRHDVRNFRQLKQSLDDFAYLLSHLDEKHLQHEEFLAHLIDNFFNVKLAIYRKDLTKKSFERILYLQKNQAVAAKEFLGQFSSPPIQDTELREKKELDQKNNNAFQAYTTSNTANPINYVYSMDSWYSILFLNSLNNINSITNQLTYFITDQQPLWLHCYDFPYLEEDKFQKLSQDILKNFDNLQYEDYYEYLHIIGLLIQWSKDRLITKTIAEITETAIRFLKQYSSEWPDKYSEKWKNFQDYQSGFDRNNWTNHGFYSTNDQNFQRIERLFQEKQQEAIQTIEKKEKEKESNIILNAIKDGNKSDLQKLLLNAQHFDFKPIFHTIDQQDFLNSLSNLTSPNIAYLNDTLKSRYLSSFSINNRPTSYYMTEEFTFWNNIKNCLETQLSKQSNEQPKSLKNYNLEFFLKTIQKIIQTIFPFFTMELLKENDYDTLKKYLCDCGQYGQYVVFNETILEDFHSFLEQRPDINKPTSIILQRYKTLTNTDITEQEYKFWQELQNNLYNPSPALTEMIEQIIQIIKPKTTQQTLMNP